MIFRSDFTAVNSEVRTQARPGRVALPHVSRAVVVGSGSLLFHAAVFALFGFIEAPTLAASDQEPAWIDFEAVQPSTPVEPVEEEPEVLPEPEPEPEVVRRPVALPEPEPREPEPDPEPTDLEPSTQVAEAPAGPAADGIHSHEGGMATDLPSGGGGSAGAPIAHRPSTGGDPEGTGEVTAPRRTVDVRGLVRGWMARVGQLLGERAGRDYPRAARRSGAEGVVVLSLVVDARGRILEVDVRRSSGHEALDSAALAMVHRVGAVPAPPGELRWEPRPLTMPIAYRLR